MGIHPRASISRRRIAIPYFAADRAGLQFGCDSHHPDRADAGAARPLEPVLLRSPTLAVLVVEGLQLAAESSARQSLRPEDPERTRTPDTESGSYLRMLRISSPLALLQLFRAPRHLCAQRHCECSLAVRDRKSVV